MWSVLAGGSIFARLCPAARSQMKIRCLYLLVFACSCLYLFGRPVSWPSSFWSRRASGRLASWSSDRSRFLAERAFVHLVLSGSSPLNDTNYRNDSIIHRSIDYTVIATPQDNNIVSLFFWFVSFTMILSSSW